MVLGVSFSFSFCFDVDVDVFQLLYIPTVLAVNLNTNFFAFIMSGFLEHPDSIRNDTDSKTMGRQIMAHTRDTDFVVFFHAIQVIFTL